MHIHLHHDYFQRSCDKDLTGRTAENIYELTLYVKSLLTSTLNHPHRGHSLYHPPVTGKEAEIQRG